jgi:hypothetical protein
MSLRSNDTTAAPLVTTSLSWNEPQSLELPSKVRAVLSTLCGEVLAGDEMDRVAMVAHELLENVVKYSIDGTRSLDVVVRREPRSGSVADGDDQGIVRIETRNLAIDRHREGVVQLIERLQAAESACDVYDELILSCPERDESGLGLARIPAEADMTLSCSSEGLRITIAAEGHVSIRRGT